MTKKPATINRDAERRALEMKVAVSRRLLRQAQARDSLLAFSEVTMPDPLRLDDPLATLYTAKEHHKLLIGIMEKVARGEILRVILSAPPQTGKSEIVCRRFIAWLIGRLPHLHLMFGTYNQDFADDKGAEVRETVESDAFHGIFPLCRFATGSRAKDSMRTTAGGTLRFLGRGGSGTGKPANGWVLDDILKNDEEADSPTIREQAWQWFTKVVFTRLQATTFVIIMATRWHDDDVIGRLTDPANAHYDEKESKNWLVINIPAILDEASAELLGGKVGEPLWPERQPMSLLESARSLNPRGFQALYMGKPAPEDGEYFKRHELIGYDEKDLPKNLRLYGASDHALTEKQENDASVLGVVGLDDKDKIWLLPDLCWGRFETDVLIDEMLQQFRPRSHINNQRPLLWWAEDEHIRKSIGPFLRKRMLDEKTYIAMDPITPSKDIRARARSIQGRMQMKMVHFPKFAGWWPDAQHELLRFPRGTHDDFVAFLALIGLGLDRMAKAGIPAVANENAEPRTGSLAWLKWSTKQNENRHVGALPGGW